MVIAVQTVTVVFVGFDAVFGVDLTTLVKLEGGVIPEVLGDLFSEIQSRGLCGCDVHSAEQYLLVFDRSFK